MYDAAEFFFGGAGRGYRLSVDSGAGMLVNGTLDYVFTFSQSVGKKIVGGVPVVCNPGVDNCTNEFVRPNFLGGGVALSQADITWLSTQNKAPEPSELLIF